MLGLELSDDEDQGTVFRDVLMLVLFGFVTIVVLVLPHLNPPEAAADATPPGNVVVEMRWPDDIDADVDLWVQAPGDTPVGYSNKGARYFNLLRDDLGKDNETTGLNFEVAFSRGTPAGEYTVNAHLYRNQSAGTPIEVVVAVSVKATRDASLRPVATRRIQLAQVGQEITAMRFTLDDAGNLVAGSIHDLPRLLRSASP